MESITIEATDPETRSSTYCRNCGSYVTTCFARVFGNNEDEVYACLECSTMRALREGSGIEQ
jgi:ferredoxin-like protein FixX